MTHKLKIINDNNKMTTIRAPYCERKRASLWSLLH